MSDAIDTTSLDSCGCCEGPPADATIENAPSLPALRYRIATHPEFLARMLRALPGAVDDSGTRRPLQRLTARTTDDPTIALLDATALVADILTFYQERLANEGFLRTATERRSVLELARSIGYELSPGVAASAHLAITVDDLPGIAPEITLPQGTQIQSVPPQDKLPQVFETSSDFVARSEWNILRPRLTRPAELAIIGVGTPSVKTLHLLGAAGTFPAASPGLLTALNPNDLFRLDTTEPSATVMDALPVTRIYLTSTAGAGLAKGDVLLFVGSKLQAFDVAILRIADVADEITRVRIDLEAVPTTAAPEPKLTGAFKFQYLSPAIASLANVRLGALPFTSATLSNTIAKQAWREADLHAMLGVQGWLGRPVMRALNRRANAEPVTPEAGAFAFRDTLGFFGAGAPRWSSLPSLNTKGNYYKKPWDADDVGDDSPSVSVSIWNDSQGHAHTAADAFLERPVKGLTARGWVVFEVPEAVQAYAIHDAREMARADFSISGRAMGLSLRTPAGTGLGGNDKPSSFTFRDTTARVGSRRLDFAELPIDSPLDQTPEIELDRLVLGLAIGQPIAIAGERDDLRGVDAAEIATLSDIIHAGGRTTLRLESPLQYRYVRDTVAICANVVHATHGETVTEVLGSGNASTSNQRFPLKKPPLTYISAPTPRGVESTLEVRVNQVRWDEASSLYLAGPTDEHFIVRIDDDARADVIFGDGAHGARVPTGSGNVTATYRSGIGADGEVAAGTLTVLRTIPLGVRGVTNPVAASGAEDPEKLDNARLNAPLTVVTFERIVSLADFEDFARAFPGIGKARAERLLVHGQDVAHLTVAGATGGAPGPDIVQNLIAAIGAATDQSQRVVVGVFRLRFFTLRARLVIDPRYVAATVMSAVTQRIQQTFSFGARDLSQSVTPSDLIACIHEEPGVVAVDLDALSDYSEDDNASVSAAAPASVTQPIAPLIARRASWNPKTGTFDPADLLLVNPVGITLEEMS